MQLSADQGYGFEHYKLLEWSAFVPALDGGVDELSLDHDLGDDEHGTGYDVLLWVEEAVVNRGFAPPRIRVHSANVSARQKMEAAVSSIERLAAGRSGP
jgi:hypothetical protein